MQRSISSPVIVRLIIKASARAQTMCWCSARIAFAQIDPIARAIGQFGFINPIIINRANKVLAGHAREASKKLSVEAPRVTIKRWPELTH
jgi:hypothetical protein